MQVADLGERRPVAEHAVPVDVVDLPGCQREGYDVTAGRIIFGMLFLKRCSDVFEARDEELLEKELKKGRPKAEAAKKAAHPSFYADTFFVPSAARWEHINNELHHNIGDGLNKALGAPRRTRPSAWRCTQGRGARQQALFDAHGLDPKRIFKERPSQAGHDGRYFDFADGITDKAALKKWLDTDHGMAKREQELTVAVEGWWKRAQRQLAELPESKAPMPLRAGLLMEGLLTGRVRTTKLLNQAAA